MKFVSVIQSRWKRVDSPEIKLADALTPEGIGGRQVTAALVEFDESIPNPKTDPNVQRIRMPKKQMDWLKQQYAEKLE
ncbi:hypothetical protein HDU98_005467 [Podochytrium sp. JEL0797]|nr:hypothetical protein HDU98_005467 [Podochytrium sp. JEL0797]